MNKPAERINYIDSLIFGYGQQHSVNSTEHTEHSRIVGAYCID